MSQFDIQSISSRSTSSAIPSSTNSFSQISNRKNGEGFVAPNSRRGGRNFKVVERQKSNASISVDKKGTGGKGFRKALGELIAGRSNLRNVAAERRDNDNSSQLTSNEATLKNCGTTSNWVHEEARRSQLREDELRRHEAVSRRGESMVESLDDQSFYAFDLQSESDEFPIPPTRDEASSSRSLSTFPNLSQLSLQSLSLEAAPSTCTPSRSSTLLTPTPAGYEPRRLSSRSSPQLRPLLLPQALPSNPLPALPVDTARTKLATFPLVSLPATPPASPPVDSSPFPPMDRSATSSSLPLSGNNDSLLAPSPTTIRTTPSRRQSFLPVANNLGLAITSIAPVLNVSPAPSADLQLQKKLDTTTRMLLKALSFDLVYLARISTPGPSPSFPIASTVDVLSSSGMPRPQPKFDPELHLSALRSAAGVLFHSPETASYDADSYKLGLLVPIVAMRKVGYLLCAFTRDETKEIGERELRWVTRFAEELEGTVLEIGTRS